LDLGANVNAYQTDRYGSPLEFAIECTTVTYDLDNKLPGDHYDYIDKSKYYQIKEGNKTTDQQITYLLKPEYFNDHQTIYETLIRHGAYVNLPDEQFIQKSNGFLTTLEIARKKCTWVLARSGIERMMHELGPISFADYLCQYLKSNARLIRLLLV